MRYTRLEIPKNTNSGIYRLLIEFFIIIPIIAIIFGGLLTRVLIIPYFTRNISSVNQSGSIISKPIIIGKEYSVSILQAGVYLNKNNADSLVKGMISKGQNAFSVQDDDVFRIIIDISEDKKMLEEKQTTLKSAGYNSLIHDYDIYIKNEGGQSNKNIDSYRYEIACLLKHEFQFREALNQKKEYNIEEIKGNLSSIESDFSKIKEIGLSEEKLAELTKYHSSIIQIGNEIVALKDLNEVNQRITSQIILINKLLNILIQK